MVWHNGIDRIRGRNVITPRFGPDSVGGKPVVTLPICLICGAEWKTPITYEMNEK